MYVVFADYCVDVRRFRRIQFDTVAAVGRLADIIFHNSPFRAHENTEVSARRNYDFDYRALVRLAERNYGVGSKRYCSIGVQACRNDFWIDMEFHLARFTGPLDLLLYLISKNKVSIYDIPIAEILEQYTAVLQEAEVIDLNGAGDFVAMAAQLLYIKSQMLLPQKKDSASREDPRVGLVEQLLEYQQFKKVSAALCERSEIGRDILVKQPERLEKTPRQYRQSVSDLLRAANRIRESIQQRNLPSIEVFSGIVGREPAPVDARITSILRRFLQKTRLDFYELFDDTTNRSEKIATFLATLELSKTHRIWLEGEGENIQLTLVDEKGNTKAV